MKGRGPWDQLWRVMISFYGQEKRPEMKGLSMSPLSGPFFFCLRWGVSDLRAGRAPDLRRPGWEQFDVPHLPITA